MQVFSFERRKLTQDFIKCRAISEVRHDYGHWNPHAPDARTAAHNLRIEGDAV